MRKPNNPFKLTISLLAASLLAACGGGGDSGASAPTSTPLNNNGEQNVNNPPSDLGREKVVKPGTGNSSPTDVQGDTSKNSGNQQANQQGNQQGNQSGTQPTTSQPTTSDSKSSSDGNSSPSKSLNPDDTLADALDEEDQAIPALELPDLESKERADAETEKAEETKEASQTDKTVTPEVPNESTQEKDSVSNIESPEPERANHENLPTEDPQSANPDNQSRGNKSESREENRSSQTNPSESGSPVTTTPAPKPETAEAKSEQKDGLKVSNTGVGSLEIKSLSTNNYRGSKSPSSVNWENASSNHKKGQEQLNHWENPIASSFSFENWWPQVEKWYKRGTADLTLEKAKDHSERFNLENALLSGRKPQVTEDVDFLPYLSQTSSLIQHRESEQSASRNRTKPKSGTKTS